MKNMANGTHLGIKHDEMKRSEADKTNDFILFFLCGEMVGDAHCTMVNIEKRTAARN